MKCRHCNVKTSNREPPVCFDCRTALRLMRMRLRFASWQENAHAFTLHPITKTPR